MSQEHLHPLEVQHFNPYVKPTVELVLSLLTAASKDQNYLDKVLSKMSEEVIVSLQKEIEGLVKDGKVDLEKKVDLANNPALLTTLKQIEQRQIQRFAEYTWLGSQIIEDSMERSYKDTLAATYKIFNYKKGIDPHNLTTGPKSLNVVIQNTDNYVKDKVVNVPWCQDGKVYSQRLYGHVSNFQQKLAYTLEEGVSKGKGMDWMKKTWRKLTGSTAYNTARLLKTETMAMWSIATKSAYLEMGIEYVLPVGDGACGTICVDFLGGDPIPLEDAEPGGLLPPYHPNCACSYVAWKESFLEDPIDAPLDADEYDE